MEDEVVHSELTTLPRCLGAFSDALLLVVETLFNLEPPPSAGVFFTPDRTQSSHGFYRTVSWSYEHQHFRP
jgi:hypothetical protein